MQVKITLEGQAQWPVPTSGCFGIVDEVAKPIVMHPESAHHLGINTRGQAQWLAPTRRFDDRGRRFFDHGPSPVGAGFHACPRQLVDVTAEAWAPL
jgi:hypothetical protein